MFFVPYEICNIMDENFFRTSFKFFSVKQIVLYLFSCVVQCLFKGTGKNTGDDNLLARPAILNLG